MFSEYRKVKYTKEESLVTTYDSGLESWNDIYNILKGISVRNKVICRIDLLEMLEDTFNAETRIKYRNAIMYLANGLCKDANTLSEVLKDLVNIDDVFSSKITMLYHILEEHESLGNKFLNMLSGRLYSFEEYFRQLFRGGSEFVICISDGYLYFSIADADYEVGLPKDFKVEVLSYARYWKGNIKVIE